jgi:thymidine phosphorylase
MAKKHSASSTHVVIDIPIRPNTKISCKKKARHLEQKFLQLGKKLGIKVKVILTDGSQPIGNGIGPALEARDVLKVLRQEKDRPLDLEKKCLRLAGELFNLVGKKNCYALAKKILASGKAYEKMKQIIALQAGNPDISPEEIRLGKFTCHFLSEKNGIISSINNSIIAKIARIAGAPSNKAAGIYMYKHIGDKIKKGEKIFTVYAASIDKIEYVEHMLKDLRDVVIS